MGPLELYSDKRSLSFIESAVEKKGKERETCPDEQGRGILLVGSKEIEKT